MSSKINLDDLQHQIDKRQLNEQEQPQNDGRPTKRVMFRLWEVMQEAYGHQWNSQYGEEPTETWERLLTGITPEQIRDGLEALTGRKDTWPPNAQEFRQLCLPATISPDGMNSDAYLNPSDPKHSQHQYWLLNRTLKLEDGSVKERKQKTGNDHLKNLKDIL